MFVRWAYKTAKLGCDACLLNSLSVNLLFIFMDLK